MPETFQGERECDTVVVTLIKLGASLSWLLGIDQSGAFFQVFPANSEWRTTLAFELKYQFIQRCDSSIARFYTI
jgi:hypothetical protein